jgi:hypothetical protein
MLCRTRAIASYNTKIQAGSEMCCTWSQQQSGKLCIRFSSFYESLTVLQGEISWFHGSQGRSQLDRGQRNAVNQVSDSPRRGKLTYGLCMHMYGQCACV